MKKIILVILLAMLLSGQIVDAKDKEYISASDMQKINLGDTFEQVTATIGEPQQVLSKELTSDGKEQVVWLYETVKAPNNDFLGGMLVVGTSTKMANQSVYQQQRMQNPPYLVVFINGKAARIDRQKVEAVPTAQVNVQSY